MTIDYAWQYLTTHCLNERVMDDDETAKEAISKIEDAIILLISADETEGGDR